MLLRRYLFIVASQSQAYLPILLAVILLVSSADSSAQAVFDPVNHAETIGAELFDAISKAEFAGPADIMNYEALQRAIDARKCPDTTVSLILLPNRRHPTELYAVSSVTSAAKLVVGRHFKTTVHGGLADLQGLSASTKSCFILPIDPRAVGLFITELIAPEPTAFHVLQARLHKIQLLIEAGGEVWAINPHGRIQKIQKPHNLS